MGKIYIDITYKGVKIDTFKGDIQAYNKHLTLEDQYNLPAVRRIVFEGDDINISIDAHDIETIHWDKYGLPTTAIATIKDLEHYQAIKNKLQKIYSEIEYLKFEDRYRMDSLAQEALDAIGSLNLSNHIDNFMLNKSSWAQRIFHTKNKEVSMLLRLREKDAKYRKVKALEDATKHLLPDIKSLMHFLQEGKLK